MIRTYMLACVYDTRGPGIDACDIASVDVRRRCAWCEQGITELSLAITENLHVTLRHSSLLLSLVSVSFVYFSNHVQ